MGSNNVISKDMLGFVINDIIVVKTARTKHDSVSLDINGKPAKDKDGKPCSASVKQTLSIDYTGMTLEEILSKAADSDRIKYQNGYARKADPKKFLLNDDGTHRGSFALICKTFFKGHVKADPTATTIKTVQETDDLELLARVTKEAELRMKMLKKLAASTG